MNVRDFLFESIYEVVTWVFIALSIGGIFYFASTNRKRVRWSIIALIFSIVMMIGLIAQRHFSQQPMTNDQGQPELFVINTRLQPLVAGQPIIIKAIVSNTARRATAKNIAIRVTVGIRSIGIKTPLEYLGGAPETRMDLPAGMTAPIVAGGAGSAGSDLIVTQEEVNAVNDGRANVFFFGRGEYEDTTGNKYPITFCYMNDKNLPGLRVCPDFLMPRSKKQ